MAKIGYARVSSYGQSLDVQLEKLDHCDRIFKEKQSGRSTEKREQLSLFLNYVRDGDTLVITKLDRLARSTRDLLNILNTLDRKQVKLHVIDQQIDTRIGNSTASWSGRHPWNGWAIRISPWQDQLRMAEAPGALQASTLDERRSFGPTLDVSGQ